MNQIKQGYKQTKVGIIPKDWDVVKLNEKSSIQRGRFSPRPRNDPQFYNGDYPFVQTNDVVNSKGKITNYSQTLNEKGLKVSKLFPQGTILMTIAANIGFTGILTRDMTCPDSLVGIQCKKGLFNEFLNFYFIFNQKRIDYLAEEAAQKNINLSTLNSFHIPLPPLKEQEKIAQILTTWDEAITKQTELLGAKELIKIALMQKLLSGEVRFGGFTDEWDEVRLGEICEYKNGGAFEEYIIENGKYLLITLNSIDISGKLKVEHKTVNINDNSLKKDDLIMVLSDVAHGDFLGLTDVILENDRYVLNQRMGALKPKKNLNSFFLSKLINLNQRYFKRHGQGSSQQNLSKGDITKFKIKLPSLPEQQKIAEVLSLADDEINLLKNELEELKLQKKALMQKLLTGEVRVKV
jgi:type I restriction enzyme S subunit